MIRCFLYCQGEKNLIEYFYNKITPKNSHSNFKKDTTLKKNMSASVILI